MSVRLSAAAHAVQVQALGELLRNGTLEVYDEPTYPSMPDTPIAEASKLLFTVPLGDSFATEGNSVVFKHLPEAKVRVQGSPKRFRVVTQNGKTVVLDGTCGQKEGEDMVLKRDDGGSLFYDGMRVQLSEFRHMLDFS